MSKAIGYTLRYGEPTGVNGVRISMLGADTVRRRSVVHVRDPSIAEVVPKAGSINDRRMGTVDRRAACTTCWNNSMDCAGHHGHMDLPVAVYNAGQVDRVARTLKCVCFYCASLLVQRGTPQMRAAARLPVGRERFNYVSLLLKGTGKRHCPECHMLQPKRYRVEKKERTIEIVPEWDRAAIKHPTEQEASNDPFRAEHALSILSAISDQDAELLGFSVPDAHPENLMMTTMVVPPPPVRPSMVVDGVGAIQRGADDITHKIKCIQKDVSKLYELAYGYKVTVPNANPRKRARADTTASLSSSSASFTPPRQRKKPSSTSQPSDASDESSTDDDDESNDDESADTNDQQRQKPTLSAPEARREAEISLQYDIATCLHNDCRGMKQSQRKSGAPTESIALRLKGKEGRVRGTMMGKRVDFTARGVIVPDPDLDVDEFGVPLWVSQVLTYTENVCSYNTQLLQHAVVSGAHGYRGANYVATPDGTTLFLARTTETERREIASRLGAGWKVARHVRDGDWVIVNRQPSLHRNSMLGHRLRVFQTNEVSKGGKFVFRLPPPATPGYNADFDGDEMNMSVVQGLFARAEVAEIMRLPRNFISAQNQKPIVGLVQDGIVGSMLMTRRDTFFSRAQAMLLLSAVQHGHRPLPPPAIRRAVRVTTSSTWEIDSVTGDSYKKIVPARTEWEQMWTGKQIFSLLVPPNVHMARSVRNGKSSFPQIGRGSDADPDDDGEEKAVIVLAGDILTGCLCKATVGCSAGGLVERIWRCAGPDAARDFVSDAQRITNTFLVQRGLSFGIDNITIDEAARSKVAECVSIAKEAGERVVSMVALPEPRQIVVQQVTPEERRVADRYLVQLGNACFEALGRCTQNRSRLGSNAQHDMVKSGSKGNPWNNIQMEAAVGAQSVSGGRISCAFDGRAVPSARITPDPLAQRLEEAGFVTRSFREGLTPQLAFHHAAASRESLVDSQANTPDTGYIQRRLVKWMESHRVWWNGMVTDVKGGIVQFLYGGDGMDPTYLQRVECPALLQSDDALRTLIEFDGHDAPDVEHAALVQSRDAVRRAMETVLLPDMSSRCTFNVPVYPAASLEELAKKYNQRHLDKRAKTENQPPMTENAPKTTLRASTAVAMVASWCVRVRATCQQVLAVKSVLTARNLIRNYHVTTPEHLRIILDKMADQYERARAANGEGVGAISAQSIGEPATQVSLNTFHSAGKGAATLTLGVPRLKEIFDSTKAIKCPSATVFLKAPWNRTRGAAEAVGVLLEHSSLGMIVDKAWVETDVAHDQQDTQLVFDDDNNTLEDSRIFAAMDAVFCSSSSPLTTTTTKSTKITNATPHRPIVSARTSPGDAHADRDTILMPPPAAPPQTRRSKAAAAEKTVPSPYWSDMIFSLRPDAMVARRINVDDVVIKTRLFLGPGSPHHAFQSGEWQMTVRVSEMPDGMMLKSDVAGVDSANVQHVFATRLQATLGSEVVLTGVSKEITATRVFEHKSSQFEPITGGHRVVCEWAIQTQGSDLRALLASPCVDATRTYSNDQNEVDRVLGIDAAIAVATNEVRQVVCCDGTYVNSRHFAIPIDTMASKGTLVPLSRHGITKANNGFLLRVSFEKSPEMLQDAAFYGERDDTSRGITQCVMLGKAPPIGTGTVEVLGECEVDVPVVINSGKRKRAQVEVGVGVGLV